MKRRQSACWFVVKLVPEGGQMVKSKTSAHRVQRGLKAQKVTQSGRDWRPEPVPEQDTVNAVD